MLKGGMSEHGAAPWAGDGPPFNWTARVASDFGGRVQGVAMSRPGYVQEEGGIRRAPR